MKMTVRAHVKNGRLLVDEPTDLPEGTELDLVAASSEGDWDLTAEQVAELRESIAQAERGELISGDDVLRAMQPPR
ncbi:MAG TPA: hypothetical protein VIF09_14280 [Polyangiaceae bacterium]|jgi:hypothetical protein